MTKFFNILALTGFIFAFAGCQKALKNPEDYWPEVEMTSITLGNDGSVTVVGNIISKGKQKGSELDYVGFCATSAEREPEMAEKQILGTVNGNQIVAVYPAQYFSADSTYRIAVWATNGHGYGISHSISADSLYLDVTPACSPTPMTFNFAGWSGSFSTVQSSGGFGEYEYTATNGPYRLIVKFPSYPTAGIYSTNSYPTAGKLQVIVYMNGSSYNLDNDQTVYVEKLSGTNYRFTVCDGTFHVTSTGIGHAQGTFDFQP